MQTDGEDRRRYPRSRRGVNVALEDSGPGVLNHVDNISANGVLCHTIKPVPLMTRLKIQLEVTVDDSHRIDAEGIIVRCERDEQGDDHFKVAILFTKMDEESQQIVHDFVSHDLEEMEVSDQ